MTNNKNEVMEVLTGPERRRRWSVDEKLAMVRETFEPGKTVSMVARLHGINPNQLFQWRKLHQDGSLSAVSAGEEVVPASELGDALKQIKELQRLLGKKTMENEIFGASRAVPLRHARSNVRRALWLRPHLPSERLPELIIRMQPEAMRLRHPSHIRRSSVGNRLTFHRQGRCNKSTNQSFKRHRFRPLSSMLRKR